jgi:RNA polymerase sigma-70 factor (ECF subfamily)
MGVENRYLRSLLQSAKAGNNAALEQLLEINLDRIYAISHRLSGNQQDAEALASRTLIEAWKQLDKIRTDVPFNLWLDSLNVHLALSNSSDVKEEKKKGRFFKKKSTEVKEPDSKISELDLEICKLPKLERTVFVLNKIENYSPDELSGMMDISSNQIREKIENAEKLLLKVESIQTRERLTKKIAESPRKIKADKKILKYALTEIYEIKLRKKVEEEKQEEVLNEIEEKQEKVTKPAETKPAKVKVKKETGIEIPSVTPGFKRGLGWAITSIAIGIAIYLIIASGSNDWEASLQSGTVTIAGEDLTGEFGFSTNEVLMTGKNSSVKIFIPYTGNISVEQNTEFKRVDKKHSAELIRGKINVNCSGAKEFFTLHIPASTISNYYPGSIYTINVKADKSGQIFVKRGWINFTYYEKEIIAAYDYYVDFDATLGPSMPYNKNSDSEFINAVSELLHTKSEMYIERIVSIATPLNALTLWNLFKYISPAKRLLVYRKLNELVPHPASITNEDILNLDSEKLQIWLKEIESNM